MSVIRILYVEDDLDFGRMTKVFLDQAGFLVELTTNVEEAWKLFHTRRPDLLLVDLDLEGSKNGIDLINDGIIQPSLYKLFLIYNHVIPKIIKSKLIISCICYIAVICLTSCVIIHITEYNAYA